MNAVNNFKLPIPAWDQTLHNVEVKGYNFLQMRGLIIKYQDECTRFFLGP